MALPRRRASASATGGIWWQGHVLQEVAHGPRGAAPGRTPRPRRTAVRSGRRSAGCGVQSCPRPGCAAAARRRPAWPAPASARPPAATSAASPSVGYGRFQRSPLALQLARRGLALGSTGRVAVQHPVGQAAVLLRGTHQLHQAGRRRHAVQFTAGLLPAGQRIRHRQVPGKAVMARAMAAINHILVRSERRSSKARMVRYSRVGTCLFGRRAASWTVRRRTGPHVARSPHSAA
jgi:hypothetical protein